MCSLIDCCVASWAPIAVAGHGAMEAADLHARHAAGARFKALTVSDGAWIEDDIIDIVRSQSSQPVARLVMDTGISLVCTPDHAIQTTHDTLPPKWVAVIDLRRGQALRYPLAAAGAGRGGVAVAQAVGWLPCKAVNVWHEQTPVPVYKIVLASQQAFIAGGILVRAGGI